MPWPPGGSAPAVGGGGSAVECAGVRSAAKLNCHLTRRMLSVPVGAARARTARRATRAARSGHGFCHGPGHSSSESSGEAQTLVPKPRPEFDGEVT